jgi:chitin-binding protein
MGRSLVRRMFSGGGHLAGTPLAPLRNKWIDVRIDVTANDGAAGRLHYTITDAGRTVVDAARSSDCWTRGNEAHPKWGIYRSIRDRAHLQDTFLLLRNMRAFRL